MKTKLIYLLMGLGLIFTFSCTKYPPDSERLLEDLAVITQYDTKIKFSDYHTYSMPVNVIEITDKDTSFKTGETAMAALKQIEKNMDARGFVKVDKSASPDFGIQVVYFQNTTVYAYYGGYYGWYGYYYPYYPVYYSSYTTGAANIELIDLMTAQPDQKLYMRWNGYIRGLLMEGRTTADITHAVDQAFIQTPELVTTPLSVK